jgi:starch synthase
MHQTPDIKTVFTIHNLAYQGPWRWQLEKITWCPWYMQGHNTMAAAVQFANRVNTVSPTYARQIQTADYGEDLEGLLSFVSGKLGGILNGIDREVFNPAVDKYLQQPFTADTLDQRRYNKVAIQEELGLEVNSKAFLVGLVGRLVEQKGLDLILQILNRFLSTPMPSLFCWVRADRYYQKNPGSGKMASRYRGRMATYLLYSEGIWAPRVCRRRCLR